MKEYIVLSVNDNTIVLDYRNVSDEEKVFVNKNRFYKGFLFYTLKYFKNNCSNIYEVLNTNKTVDYVNLKIKRLVTFKYVIPMINGFKLSNIILDFCSTLDLKDYDLFLNCKTIKNIYCYYMPVSVQDKFKAKGVNIYTSSMKEITWNFFSQQDAFEKDTLYYKNVIKITEEYPELIEDLREFLKINYNLKAIHVYVYSKELIESIVDLVKNDESRNVVVFFHQGYDKGNFIVNNFAWLRELSEKCKEDYTCEFRIIYANSFLRNNLFKQLTFNNLKLISILCVYVCVVSLIIVKAYDYIEEISVEQLRNQIASIDNRTIEYSDDEDDDEYDELPDEDMQFDQNLTKEEIKSKYTFSNSFKSLKKINKETKGYLIVKNTEISYPVVQHSDNNYYLKNDFYKKKTSMGWIYMDYRNHIDNFDDNTIIYGHSMLNGTMFGTLKKVLNTTWRKNEDNMIITFDTEKGNYKFKIFSAYKVDYTTDYLITNFDSVEEKLAFIKMIKGRSSFKSKEDLDENDKILTLSTCAGGNNRRLVVHAVLIRDKEEETEENIEENEEGEKTE
ncbi:MAG: class B sortase [Bacilli bacterium]|nr:class B sortase [Bacilli bacterium]